VEDSSVKILDGNTFIVCETNGDFEASAEDPTGMFSYDTRFLSRWVLTINGQRLSPLSVDDLHYFQSRFFLIPGTGSIGVDKKLSVVRDRTVCEGFHEVLTVSNHDDVAADLEIRLEASSDFADLFEVKDVLAKKGKYRRTADRDRLVLGYDRQKFSRETVITATKLATVDKQGLTFTCRIEPDSTWETEIHVNADIRGFGGQKVHIGHAWGSARSRSVEEMVEDLQRWVVTAPRLESDWDPLKRTYRRSLIDLAALRFSPDVAGDRALPSAGLPWFMTMFGRDSILTSLQTLAFTPELAATTLTVLGEWQSNRVDDFRDEEPGKIPHELRYGELTAFDERPHSPYYGTADATPLFVVLMDEYERWTGDTGLVERMEPTARAALNWIDEYGDLMGNGYIAYQRRNEETGLENQCWKDSWDAINYRNGYLPDYPRATCELQGYAYDAKIRGARLAREIWNDPMLADRLEAEAADLRGRFNEDFWIEDGQYFAVALDGGGRKVDSLTSNIGHLLWSGIVDDEKAKPLVEHLMGPHLFSGWGVRTLSDLDMRYNPIGYHVGTVWPFENSFIAWGLRRYGYHQEAAKIATGMLDAAEFFNGRLPEAFAGQTREETNYPVEYPTACSPQAWSTGTPMLLVKVLLGLEPVGNHLIVEPALPEGMGRLDLLGIPGRWGRLDAFARSPVPVASAQAGLRAQLGKALPQIARP
jgi:glycogen debranching enzyme